MTGIPSKLDGIHLLSLVVGVAIGYLVLPRVLKKVNA